MANGTTRITEKEVLGRDELPDHFVCVKEGRVRRMPSNDVVFSSIVDEDDGNAAYIGNFRVRNGHIVFVATPVSEGE